MKEKILNLLETSYDALDIMAINDALNLSSVEELQELQETLDELVDELVVYLTKKNKYILYTKCPNFKKGKISINKKGFGFLILDEEEDIHIAKNELGYALDNDFVLVEVINNDPNNREGRVIKILKRDLNNIVGVIKNDGKFNFFEPIEKLNIKLEVDEKTLKPCVDGEIVVVSIIKDLGKNKYYGKVSKHICHKDDASKDILTIAAKYDIYAEFPDEAMDQAEEMPIEVEKSDYVGRIDLRDKMIFTIDGKDTKDIDDAISLEIKDGHFILGVHIADVSHYVSLNSPLDIEAQKRGTSSYLASSVIPMLPHKLSNGICSLNPNVERLTLSCVMEFNESGKLEGSDIFPSIIKSFKKMNYDDVNSILENNIIPDGYEDFSEILKNMQSLAHLIRDERNKRGTVDFNVSEAKVITNENGEVVDIVKRNTGEGERLIEDFMICANECVAKTLAMLDVPAIYRVHDLPKKEKVQAFINFCNATGHVIKGKFNVINPKTFKQILEQLKLNEEEANIYRSLAIKSMAKAYYSPNNIGHFGLASKFYTHFTSPIRRYPDLETHRLVHEFIINNDFNRVDYYKATLPSITKLASERELASIEAERDVLKVKMAEYMEKHLGEEFDGIISGVVGFGIFVQLPNLVEGLVPITALDDDFYDFIEEYQCLIGKRTKKRYTIGERLHVRCVGANKHLAQVDFEIV